MINAYNYYVSKNYGSSLYEIYNNYSNAKERALIYCKELKKIKDGFNPCFCGHNCMTFTYAFLFIENNKTYLCYITPSYDYMMEYPD